MEASPTASVVEKGVVVQRKEALPATINKLKSFIVFKEEVAKNYKSRLLLLKETNAAKAQVEATYEDSLKVSELLFDAYQRLGQLVEQHTARPTESGKTGGRGKKGNTKDTSLLTVRRLAREMKVSESWLQQMKLISKKPQYTREAFKLARQMGPEAGTPPTKTQIVNTIRSAEKQVDAKRHKPQPSGLGKCTRAILEALGYLKRVDWRSPPSHEIPAFNDAVSSFQRRVEEYQNYIKRQMKGASENGPSTESDLDKSQQIGLIPRWMRLNWKPVLRRLFITTANHG